MRALRVVSLFAGIGGFDLGLAEAGFEIVAHVEKDADCRRLLAARWPHARALDDVCAAGRHNLPAHEVLCGGWPCQDLSVAGLRKGLGGARSGLFYEFTRIADECQPAYVLWENVPGLLTSDDGRDMLRVVREFQRIGYGGGWRTLDAQYFGVAQRRRRVFGVFARVDLGTGGCAEVLSLAEGVRGHPAPFRETGQGVAGTLTRSALDGSGACGGACGGDGREGLMVCGTLNANGKAAGSATQQDAECGLLVAHTLRAQGFDASEDGTGRGTPLVAVEGRGSKDEGGEPLAFRAAGQERFTPSGICPPIAATSGGGAGVPTIVFPERMSGTQCASAEDVAPVLQAHNPTAVAFSCKDHGADAGDIAPTLRAMNFVDSHLNGGGQVAVAFSGRARGDDGRGYERGPQGMDNGIVGALDTVKPWNVAAGPNMSVRRLTPRECERLQGFPDDWTAGFSDSPRYRMLGNAVNVRCAVWLGKRLYAAMQSTPGMKMRMKKPMQRIAEGRAA